MTGKGVLDANAESKMVQRMLDAMQNPQRWFTPVTYHVKCGSVGGPAVPEQANASVERS